MLPFMSLYKQIVVRLIYFVVFWPNMFMAKQGISEKIYPREIVPQQQVDFNKHCKVQFRAYVEEHDGSAVTNDMNNHTRPSIALGPSSGNTQGGQKVFCLITGMVLKNIKINDFTMPNHVITKMNQWVARPKH